MRRPDPVTVEKFSSIVADIYDAALDTAEWPRVLPRIAEFVGGHGVCIGVKQSSGTKSDIYFNAGLPTQDFIASYIATYSACDPFTTAHLLAKAGQIFGSLDSMEHNDFLDSRMYREWIRPQDLVDSAVAILDRSETSIALAVVYRHATDGMLDDQARARMHMLVPHLRRAVSLTQLIESKTAHAASLAQTLDGLNTSVFLVDRDCRVCHANESARSMLRKGSVFWAADGRLVANGRAASAALADACAAGPSPTRAPHAKSRSIGLPSEAGARQVMHVLPLSLQSQKWIGCDAGSTAAIFVQADAPLSPSAHQVLAETYKLTASELRILLAIVEGGSVADIADTLGLGQSTVRTHLHRLFAKTAASRQSDLVRLVAKYASPLAK